MITLTCMDMWEWQAMKTLCIPIRFVIELYTVTRHITLSRENWVHWYQTIYTHVSCRTSGTQVAHKYPSVNLLTWGGTYCRSACAMYYGWVGETLLLELSDCPDIPARLPHVTSPVSSSSCGFDQRAETESTLNHVVSRSNPSVGLRAIR
jgi:hypothetical protein